MKIKSFLIIFICMGTAIQATDNRQSPSQTKKISAQKGARAQLQSRLTPENKQIIKASLQKGMPLLQKLENATRALSFDRKNEILNLINQCKNSGKKIEDDLEKDITPSLMSTRITRVKHENNEIMNKLRMSKDLKDADKKKLIDLTTEHAKTLDNMSKAVANQRRSKK